MRGSVPGVLLLAAASAQFIVTVRHLGYPPDSNRLLAPIIAGDGAG
jgi:hypothetical protein